MEDTLMRRASRLMFRVMAYRPPPIRVPLPGLILTDVTVVNPGEVRCPHQTVVVEGDRIVRITFDPPPLVKSPPQVDGAGTWVLPGLIDMHVHIPPLSRELVNLLFLAYGVTTVRETGDVDGSTWEARRRIQGGRIPGPRIFASGPVLDGDPPFLFTSWKVRNAAEARQAVAALAQQGADFIKVHHKLSTEALVAIREAAAEHGLRVVGHIPESVPFEAAHVWDVQHLDGVVPYPQPSETLLDVQKKWRDLDPARIEFYVRTSVEQGLVHTPTLVTSEALIRMADPHAADDPAVHLLPRYYRDGVWDRRTMPLFHSFTDETLDVMKQGMKRGQEIVRRLDEAGVRLHLGTDTVGMPFTVPGESLHREFRLMVETGLSREAVWKAGTSAAGASLGLPQLGVVQTGAPADLLIFEQDPTASLTALSTLKGVVADGRYYAKTFLDEALARHRERFEWPAHEKFTLAFIRLSLKMMASKR
jgi:hypothetical protein